MISSNTLDTIFIENLCTNCIIGLLEHERVNPQPLVVNIELYTDLSKAMLSDNIEDTINYAEISDVIENIANELKALTVEHLANVIINKLRELYYPQLQGVKLSLAKPKIMPNGANVGVVVTRMFKE